MELLRYEQLFQNLLNSSQFEKSDGQVLYNHVSILGHHYFFLPLLALQ